MTPRGIQLYFLEVKVMDEDLAQKAVALALLGNWEEAVKTNKKILKKAPKDIEALNRLAKAYWELGKVNEARKVCQRTLKVDAFNPISQKNLEKWICVKGSREASLSPSSASDFIEEPGKTKLVELLNPGDKNTLAKLSSGDEVFLSLHTYRVSVLTKERKHVGRLPDDLSARLRQAMKSGNSYKALIKSIEGKNVSVFLKILPKALA